MNWGALLSAIGVLIAALSGILYIRTILKGQTKPSRVSWGGWTLVGVLGLLSSREGGAGIGLLVAVVITAVVAVTFVLSLNPKYGKPGGETLDYAAGGVAAVALLTKPLINYSPAIGATIAILADVVFLWPTLRSSWRHPEYEALYPWVIGTIALLLGAISLGKYNFSSAAYPIYIFLADLSVVVELALRGGINNRAKKLKRV